jgi:hypothetical protein
MRAAKTDSNIHIEAARVPVELEEIIPPEEQSWI